MEFSINCTTLYIQVVLFVHIYSTSVLGLILVNVILPSHG